MNTKKADAWEARMESGWKADAHGSSMPLWFDLRRRETDGYTRVEVTTSTSVHVSGTYGNHHFTVYLTDDERRQLAKALLAGIDA